MPKTHHLVVRMTKREHDFLKQAAKKDQRVLSDWVRRNLIQIARMALHQHRGDKA